MTLDLRHVCCSLGNGCPERGNNTVLEAKEQKGDEFCFLPSDTEINKPVNVEGTKNFFIFISV